MLIGVISDTHGNLKAIQEACRQLRQAKVDLILHLGDDYRDIDWFVADGFRVIAVPGLYCPEYQQPQIPNQRLEELQGIRFLLTHSPAFQADAVFRQSDRAPQVILYGHTHIPAIKAQEGVLWINPGHLREHDKKGYPASYALLRLEPPHLAVEIITLADGAILTAGSYILPLSS